MIWGYLYFWKHPFDGSSWLHHGDLHPLASLLEALSKHVHRSDYRETAKRRLERHVSQRRQATVEAKAWRRGGGGGGGVVAVVLDGFEEKKLWQNSKKNCVFCSKLCNISFFDLFMICLLFWCMCIVYVLITNICSQKKICRIGPKTSCLVGGLRVPALALPGRKC